MKIKKTILSVALVIFTFLSIHAQDWVNVVYNLKYKITNNSKSQLEVRFHAEAKEGHQPGSEVSQLHFTANIMKLEKLQNLNIVLMN